MRPLPRVNSAVLRQGRFLRKGLVTVRTHMRPLPRVGPAMFEEVGLLGEALGADGAAVRLLSIVFHQILMISVVVVRLEIGPLTKALTALVGRGLLRRI